MSALQQIYCTHCTYGSSALERRSGELSARMVGYSARSGSLKGPALRSAYRQLEGYVYYYLPRDTPAEQKHELSASTAPRRLIYIPSVRGLRVAGQVCYRTTDSEGRPGSYFAHLIFQDVQKHGPDWTGLDTLRLWKAAGWAEEDGPAVPFDVPPLGSPGELLLGHRPALEDNVLRSFLTTPANGQFDDPASVIPPRWRALEPGARLEAAAFVMTSLLSVRPEQRQSVLLVAEPEVAALLFYAALRFLPRGPIVEPISFSTFEPEGERATATLTATTFSDPSANDLRPEVYRGPGIAWNTFSGQRSSHAPRQWPLIVRWMLNTFCQYGPEAVDGRLRVIEAVGPGSPSELELLAHAERLVPVWFGEPGTAPHVEWRNSPAARQYLQRLVVERIAAAGSPAAALDSVVGRAAQLVVLELLAGLGDAAEAREAMQFLLSAMPMSQIGDVLRLGGLSVSDKAMLLARLLRGEGPLPPELNEFWDKPIVGLAIGHLDRDAVGRLAERMPSTARLVVLQTVIRAASEGSLPPESITPLVESADDAMLLALFRRGRAELFQHYPAGEPALSGKLAATARSLNRYPEQFSARLDLLLAAQGAIADAETRQIVAAWADCRRAILDIGRMQADAPSMLQRGSGERLEEAVRRMVAAAAVAMPRAVVDDDKQGSRKQESLRRIGRALLQGNALLGGDAWQFAALWQKVAWFFEMGIWPSVPLARMRPKSWKRSALWVGSGAAALLIVLLLFGALRPDRNRPTDAVIEPKSAAAQDDEDAAEPELPTVADAREQLAQQDEATPASDSRLQDDSSSASEAAEPDASGAWHDQDATIDRPDAAAAHNQAESTDPPPLGSESSSAVSQANPADGPAPSESVGPAAETHGVEDAASTMPDGEPPSEPSAAGSDSLEATDDNPNNPAGDFDSWKAAASSWGDRTRRYVVENEPLVDGRRTLDDSELPPIPADHRWYLASGWIHTSVADFPFGRDFRSSPPTTRQTVEAMAEPPLVPEVAVELGRLESGYRLAVVARPARLPPPPASGPRADLHRAQSRLEHLQDALRRAKQRDATVEEQRQAFAEMGRLVDSEVPPILPRPPRYDPDGELDQQAWARKQREYRENLVARTTAYAKAEAAALAEVGRLREAITAMAGRLPPEPEDQAVATTLEPDEAEQRATELLRRCRTISALLYARPEGAEPPVAESSAGRTDGVPPVDKQPGQAPPPSDRPSPAKETHDELPVVAGRFSVEEDPAYRLNPPAIARLKLIVVVGGLRPPPWYRDDYVTGAIVRTKDEAGRPVRRLVSNIEVERDIDVLDRTTAVSIRFVFGRRTDGPYNQEPKLQAQTPWHTITSVEEGIEYTVKFDASRRAVDQLREGGQE